VHILFTCVYSIISSVKIFFNAGKKLSESIITEKLAACVNRVPGMPSSFVLDAGRIVEAYLAGLHDQVNVISLVLYYIWLRVKTLFWIFYSFSANYCSLCSPTQSHFTCHELGCSSTLNSKTWNSNISYWRGTSCVAVIIMLICYESVIYAYSSARKFL